MKLAEMLLKLFDGIISLLIIFLLLAAAAWAAYSLWDDTQVLRQVQDVQRSFRELRPTADNGEGSGPDFRKLQEQNADICAWLTLKDTNIDDPIVQGEDNKQYLNTGADKNPSLGGSLFLDARNSRDFMDEVQVLYGHNVEENIPAGKRKLMFGELLDYRDAVYFEDHREGSLMVPGREWKLHVFACLQTDVGEELIFNPGYAAENRSRLLDYAEEHAEQADHTVLTALRSNEEKILTMTTCTLEGTEDRRTAVLAWMEDAA